MPRHRRLLIEPLEERSLLATLVNTGTAADVIYTLPAGASVAFLEDDGVSGNGSLQLRSGNGTFDTTVFANPSGSLTINRGNAADTLTVNALPDLHAALSIGSSAGPLSSVVFAGNVSLAAGKSLVANATGTISLSSGNSDLATSGNGSISLSTATKIALLPGSSIITVSGPIALSANQQATPTSGDFVGIEVNGATIKSTSGDISLAGRGGTGSAKQVGVLIHGLGIVGDALTGTGTVTVIGTGGTTPAGSQGGNVGVQVGDNGGDAGAIKSGGGNIVVTGTGGADAPGHGFDDGVFVFDSAINAGGSGTLTITGTAPSTVNDIGVDVEGGTDALKTASGKMMITGTGGRGVVVGGTQVNASADIDVTGTATGTVVGTDVFGIELAVSNINTFNAGNIKLTSDSINLAGAIDVEGRALTLVTKSNGRPINLGGSDTPTQLGLQSFEMTVINAGTISIGDGSSGPITVSDDVTRLSPTAVNLTSGGAINFSGGLLDTDGGNLTLTPGSTAAATFTKTGTDASVDTSTDHGAVAFGSGADTSFAINGTTADSTFDVMNVTGNVNLTGADVAVSGSYTPITGNSFAIVTYTGTRSGTFNNNSVTLNGKTLTVIYDDANKRVLLFAAPPGTLEATLASGNLTITDVDATGKDNNLTVSTSSGNLVISDANELFIAAPPGGMLINGNKTLTIPLSSVNSLTINGAGGNDAITTSGATAFTAALTINGGTGNDTINLNSSMTLALGNSLNVDLQDDDAAPGTDVINVGANAVIGLAGSGAATLRASKNIAFANASSLTTVDGAIALAADQQATPTSGSFKGIDVNGATIQATGTGAVTAQGKGGTDSGGFQYGVVIQNGGRIKGGSGGAQVTGTGGGSGSSSINAGVRIAGASQVSAVGSGPVTVQGTGGIGSGGSNYGVWLLETGSAITSGGGNVEVTGQGGAGGSNSSVGVLVYVSALLSAGGSGGVTVHGTGGDGTGNGNIGVEVSSATITSSGGSVQVTGQGGGSGTSAFNIGAYVTLGQISAGGSGAVTVQGTGGSASGDLNYGVDVNGTGGAITSSGGNVQVIGQAGGSGASNFDDGVSVDISGTISARGSGTVVVQGTGGPGSGSLNEGVSVSGSITSGGGNVQVSGIEGAGASGTAIDISGGTISTATNGGTLTLIGNSMKFNSTATASAGASSSVTLRPLTNGVAVNLGPSSDPIGGPLSLSDTELDRVSAGAINIGDANSGPITISAAINRGAGSTTAINLTTGGNNSIAFTTSGSIDAKNGNVTLLTNSSGGGAITSGTAANDVLGANLSFMAGSGGIGASANPLVFAAINLNSTTGANANQFLAASGSATIDATGLSAGTGTIELDGGTFTLGGSDRINNGTNLKVNGGTFAIGANSDTVGGLTLASGSVTGTAGVLTSTTPYQTQSGSIGAVLAGSVGLTQSTSGTTVLSGANTYSGDTTLTDGTIKLGAANVIPDGTGKANVIFGSGTIDLSGFSETINGLSGSGGVIDSSVDGGPITLSVGGNNATTTFGGVIKNTAGILNVTKIGTGTLTLDFTNSYSGATTINQGVVSSRKAIPDTSDVTIASGATLNLADDETIGGLYGAGSVTETKPSTLAIFRVTNGGDYAGSISGFTALQVNGSGKTLTLSGTNTYTSTTTISNGTLLVNGTNSGGGFFDVQSGGTLGGIGSINAPSFIQVQSGGHLAPGSAGPGILSSRNVNLMVGSNFDVTLNGTTAGSQHSQQNVTGTVIAGPATTLNVVLGFTPTQSDAFTIINNDSNDAIGGTFSGLPEGKIFTVTSGPFRGTFQISYKGGDGNDVVLTAVSPNNPTLDGTSGNDTWLVKRNGANDDITLNGTVIMSTPASSLTTLTLNGLAGSDTLTVDSSAGDPFPSGGITFHGGNNSGDKLIVTGGSFTTITNNYTSTGPGHSGNIVFVGSQTDTLNYDGLAPIDISGSTATNLVFNLPPNASTAFLEDEGTTSNNIAQLRSSNGTFETTVFSNPSGNVTINRGNSGDALTVNNLLGNDFNAGLTIGAASSEFSTVTFAGGLTLTANKSLSVNATGIIFLSSATSDLAVSGTGTVTMTTAQNISLASGSSVTSADGNITLLANQQATPTSGVFTGVTVNAATIQSTGAGALSIQGKGGTGTDNQNGVLVLANGLIKGGTGGLLVLGQGGANASDAGTNVGVWIDSAHATATGTGAVNIQGFGGFGNSDLNSGVVLTGTGTVTSGGGNIQITGVGGGTGSSGSNRGVELDLSATKIIAGGSGTVTIEGIGGSSSGANNDGVAVFGGTISSNGGNVQITGIEGSGPSGLAIGAGEGAVISAPTNNAALSLIGNSIAFGGATISAASSVTLRPFTSGVGVNLGFPVGSDPIGGPLGLADMELDQVSAGTINIGDPNTGAITISAAIDRLSGSTTAINLTTGSGNNIAFTGSGSLDAKNGNVTLLTNSSGTGAIISGTAAVDVSGATISLTAGSGGIGTSGNPLAVLATNLNATTDGNGNQFLSASGSTTIDATGLSAGTGTIDLDGGTFTLGGSNRISSTSSLNVNGGTLALGTNSQALAGVTLTSGSITGSGGVLTSNSTIQTQSGSISAILAGNVGLTQSTSGTTTLSGPNSYSGDTTISQGTLQIGSALAIPSGPGKGNVVLNPAAGTATLDLNGKDISINGLSSAGAGASVVDNSAFGSVFFNVGLNDQTTTFGGSLKNTNGSVFLVKQGFGTLTLTGTNTNSRIDIADGKVLVNGTATQINVSNGGTLGGTGTVGQVLVGAPAAHLAPGVAGAGVLSSGNLTLNGGIFDVDINGTTLQTEYDQQDVTGTVSLGFSPLNVNLGYIPAVGDSFRIVKNDGIDGVTSIFRSLPEGTIFGVTSGSLKADLQITYHGGDGNDVVLTAVNVPPTLDAIANQTIAEDALQQTINLAGITSGGTQAQTISITATSDKPGIIPNPTITYTGPNSTGTLKFQPIANQNGLVTITVTVQDDGGTAAGGDTFTRTFTVNVTEVNDPPVATPDLLTAEEDSTDNLIAVLSNDSPGPNESSQTLTVTAAAALHGSVTINADGTLSYTPAADYNGPDTISYSIVDNGTTNGAADPLTADGTVAVTVTEVNDAPIAVDDSLPSVAEDSGDGAIALATLLANDSAGPANESSQTLSITAISNVVGGTAALAGDNIVFRPAGDFNGTFSFVYTLVDDGTTNGQPDAKMSTATVSFTVDAINDAPMFVKGDDQAATDENPATHGPALQVVVPGWATNIAPGPATATNEAVQTLHFEVTPVAPGPTGDAALFTASGQPAIAADGTLTFTPAPNAHGTAHFSIVLNDDGGTANGGADTSAVQTFDIVITKPHIWHNTKNGLDVDDDDKVAPGDALAAINYINAFGNLNGGHVPALGSTIGAGQTVDYGKPFGYIDINADDFVAPNDALAVINAINAHQGGEGETSQGSVVGSQESVGGTSNDLMTLLAIDVASQSKRRR